MIKAFKKRSIDPNKPVEVYRNLNKPGVTYSIRQNGRVVAHGTNLKLTNCTFKVNQSGFKEWKRTGVRNVHAYVQGFLDNARCHKQIVARIQYKKDEGVFGVFHGTSVGYCDYAILDEKGIGIPNETVIHSRLPTPADRVILDFETNSLFKDTK